MAAGVLLLAPAAHALDRVEMSAPGAPDDLVASLQSASLVVAARREGTTRGDEVLAAAQADYARLVAALYEDGQHLIPAGGALATGGHDEGGR
ncbi:MAG: hypothetical protein AAFR34_12390, partial [Pseudomonadota bacterium]